MKNFLLCHIKEIVVVALISIGIIIFGLRNLQNPNFWYDEALQFFFAKGIDYQSPSMTTSGSAFDALSQNILSNADPGGFTIVLHYWSKFSTNPTWLRLIPFLGSIGFIICFILLIWKLTGSTLLGLFTIIPILYSTFFLRYGIELRAYSMQTLGILLTTFTALLSINHKKYLLITGLLSSLFLWTRYSFIIHIFGLFVVLMVMSIEKSYIQRVNKLFAFLLPTAISMIFVYIVVLRNQDCHLCADISPYLLRGKSMQEIIKIIVVNFFSIYSIFISLVLFIGAYYWKFRQINSRIAHSFRVISLWIGAEYLFYIALSIVGKYPWYITTRWGLDMQIFAIISCMMVVWFCLSLFIKKLVISIKYKNIIGILVYIACAICTLIPFFWTYHPNDSQYSNIVSLINRKSDVDTIFVGYNASPMVRYHFEFGLLRNSTYFDYPKKFIFESKESYINREVIDIPGHTIYLLTADRNEVTYLYLPRIKQAIIDITNTDPSRMYVNK